MLLGGGRHNNVKLNVGIIAERLPEIPGIDTRPGLHVVENGTGKYHSWSH
jgi:hypothetical protein